MAASCRLLFGVRGAPVSLVPEEDLWGAEAQRLHLEAFNPKSLCVHVLPRARISRDTRTKIANFNVEEGAARNKLRQNI